MTRATLGNAAVCQGQRGYVAPGEVWTEKVRRRILGHQPRRAFRNIFGSRRTNAPQAFATANFTKAFAIISALARRPK
jgi:hypothetical protein